MAAGSRSVDLREALAVPLPITVIGELLGVPPDKREHPGDDLLSALITVRDTDADRLSEAKLVMAVTLIMAGYVTAAMATGLGTILLTGHDQLARLAANRALARTAVEEVLRFQAAGGDIARVAAADLTLAGVPIHAGDKVITSITSANRDERQFTDPVSGVTPAAPIRHDLGVKVSHSALNRHA